ncbi:MAG: hypothetical protein ACPGUV_00480 [Polyangiales bacterium]
MPDSIDSPLTNSEIRFLQALQHAGVRTILVGLSAAVLQGADTATQELDLWFDNPDSPGIAEAARAAGGFFAARMQPPMIGGPGLERIDIVMTCQGLDDFDAEYARCLDVAIGEVRLRVLPIERVLYSKQCAGRPKDTAVLPQLRAAVAARKARPAQL